MTLSQADRRALLAAPNEALSYEYKSWIDLGSTHGKATLAKAAIALANHGGGVVILGMREEGGTAFQSSELPEDFPPISQDSVNSAINRYCDPEIHSTLVFEDHPETGVTHPIVVVSGDTSVPVMATRDCEGVIQARRCYVRKPGPRSEEPHNSDEWRRLFDRCLNARRQDMLDAIRNIVQGRPATPPAEAVEASLLSFENESDNRWRTVIESLPDGDHGRMPNGYYSQSFKFLDAEPAASLTELRNRMDEAGRVRLTGWGPFITLNRPSRPVEGAIEAWLGAADEGRFLRDAAHSDFWRAKPDGHFFIRRGYDEDSTERFAPGAALDITLPVWRVSETLLYISRLARLFGENPQIVVRCVYSGLQGRFLGSHSGTRMLFNDRISNDDVVELSTQVSAREVEDNTVEVMLSLLTPLYERFDFFELSEGLVAEEISRMRDR